MAITYTVQLRYSPSDFLGYGPIRTDGTRSLIFGKVSALSEVAKFNSYVEALSAVVTKYVNISEDYLTITPTEEPTVHTTYTVQLRHVPSHFLGTKVTPGRSEPSLVFDELHNLATVSHFDTEDLAFTAAVEDSDYEYITTRNNFIITPFTQPAVKRFEVWITIQCKNGLRTFVLSGHNSFTPIMDSNSDLQPLHFSSEQNAQKYADSLELTDYRVMQLGVIF